MSLTIWAGSAMREGNEGNTEHQISRRSFVGVAAAIAGSSVFPAPGAPPQRPTLQLLPGVARSRVAHTFAAKVTDGPVVHRAILKEMLEASLTSFTGATSASQAWHAILKAEDVIGLKFNRSGQSIIGTTTAVADVIVGSLVDAGWSPEQIVCIEAPKGVEARLGTTPAVSGFDSKPVGFGSGSDNLASVLRQVTALITVPFLKTHNIARMTGCLKNLSHGLVKHPARYHANECSPFVADIVGLPEIQGKLRLCLVDATRVVYEGGPDAKASTVAEAGILLASRDPVAADTIGLSVLNDVRRRQGLPPIARFAEEIAYLAAGHRAGLGVGFTDGIDVVHSTI